MAKVTVAPTKSNWLTLKGQLAVAEEGFDLLEQKRQILTLELVNRFKAGSEVAQAATSRLADAFWALRESLLDMGKDSVDGLLPAVSMTHRVTLSEQRLMGIKLPRASVETEGIKPAFGPGGTSASIDVAMRLFVELLPLLARLAEVQTAMARLARELRKTRRRCNALSKIFIPEYRETITYILGTLEERERESFVILKMIRARLQSEHPNGKE